MILRTPELTNQIHLKINDFKLLGSNLFFVHWHNWRKKFGGLKLILFYDKRLI